MQRQTPPRSRGRCKRRQDFGLDPDARERLTDQIDLPGKVRLARPMLQRAPAAIAEMPARRDDPVGARVQYFHGLGAPFVEDGADTLARQSQWREIAVRGQPVALRAYENNADGFDLGHLANIFPVMMWTVESDFGLVNIALNNHSSTPVQHSHTITCGGPMPGHQVDKPKLSSDRRPAMNHRTFLARSVVAAIGAALIVPGVANSQQSGGYPPPPPPPPPAYGSTDCHHAQTGSTVIGALVGAGIGAILGGALAAEGHGGDGAALGAGLGAVGGGIVGSGSSNCNDRPPQQQPYGANSYGPAYAQAAEPPPLPPPPPPPSDGDSDYYGSPPPPPPAYGDQGYGPPPPPPGDADQYNEPPSGGYPPR